MFEHLQLVQGPTAEPLTLEVVKLDRGIEPDDNEHDSRLELLISAARSQCEKRTRRSLMTQKWAVTALPVGGRINLPRWPVQAVESVEANGVAIPFSARLGDGARVMVTSSDLVTVTYTAGYGDTADMVPEDLRVWMLLQIGSANENREADVTNATTATHKFVDLMLDPYLVPIGG